MSSTKYDREVLALFTPPANRKAETALTAYLPQSVQSMGQSILAIQSGARPVTIAQTIDLDYVWQVPEHKTQAAEFIEALKLAYTMHLPTQVDLNHAAVMSLVTKDMATGFYLNAVRHLGYDGSLKVEHYPQAQSTVFRVLIERVGNVTTEWVIAPANSFSHQIPVHALRAMAAFADAPYQPHAYWVADKIQTITVPQRIDPILLAQFGAWFAAIAWWL